MPMPRSVEHFLQEQHVPYSVLHHQPAYTPQEEAALAHVPGNRWAKTVTCIADERPILAVVPARSLVDLDRLREVSGAGAIRLANEREVERFYPDCEVGAMPPLGPLYGQAVFVDRSLAAPGDIVFDAGSHSAAVKVKYDEFARVVHPTVGDFGLTRRVPIEH
jgi:Ala-tRNA(Pro) deacylase